MAKEKKNLITPECRGSYVNFIEPRKVTEDADPAYSVLIPLKKDSKATEAFMKRLLRAVDDAVTEKFGKKIAHSKLRHFPIKDGDKETDEDGNVNPHHAGCYLIRASSKFKPQVIDKNGNTLYTNEEVYSGAWYRVSISVWAWSHKTGGKGVSINLHNAMKVKDDERFGGGTTAAQDFGDLISEDDDENEDEDEDDLPF